MSKSPARSRVTYTWSLFEQAAAIGLCDKVVIADELSPDSSHDVSRDIDSYYVSFELAALIEIGQIRANSRRVVASCIQCIALSAAFSSQSYYAVLLALLFQSRYVLSKFRRCAFVGRHPHVYRLSYVSPQSVHIICHCISLEN